MPSKLRVDENNPVRFFFCGISKLNIYIIQLNVILGTSGLVIILFTYTKVNKISRFHTLTNSGVCCQHYMENQTFKTFVFI